MKWLRHNHQPCLPLGPGGTRISGSAAHAALSRQAAGEGMVLLKNEENTLPLTRGQRVVLLGKGSTEYIKGGGGSGDVTVAYVRNLYESMTRKQAEGKVQVYEGLQDFYREEVASQHAAGTAPGMTREPVLTRQQWEDAAAFSDTAILSICRFSGEGWDRYCAEGSHGKLMETGGGEEALRQAGRAVFARGDFYLSDEEELLVQTAKQYFKRLIVVLNVGGMVDTAWIAEDPRISAAVFAGQGGMEGALALGDLLCGDLCPSGRLTDTFARTLEDYPSTEGFHDSVDYVNYTEDIYVGYRYFETLPGKQERVIYPFGYGLSYTRFERHILSEELTEDAFRCTVEVRNVGGYAGKEIVSLYYSAPQGKLGKPARVLGTFGKTALLAPGEAQTVELAIRLSSMASYDDLGKVCESAWVLEEGLYRFFLGGSVRDAAALDTVWNLSEDRVTERLSRKLTPRKLPCRMLADGSFEELPILPEKPIQRPDTFRTPEIFEGLVPESRLVLRYFCDWSDYAEPPRPQLLEVAEGRMTLDAFLDALTLDEQVQLLGGQPNRGVANTWGMGNDPVHGIPNVMTADGPAGVRILPQLGVCTTAWPCATLLACTWNTELVTRVGQAAALEVKENNIGIWLAPALNIHRSPLCGRNFEYYSEDPLVAGRMGAAMVRGVQSQGIAATPKHFAFNNKETNRKGSDSRLSERAAREIYLRGFEIIVKEANPWLIMSSYNRVNGEPTSECRELLTDILRGEWGFDGIVTTDWWTRAEHWREVKAGNDVKMACGYPEEVLEAVRDGRLTAGEVRTCAKRVLTMILRME